MSATARDGNKRKYDDENAHLRRKIAKLEARAEEWEARAEECEARAEECEARAEKSEAERETLRAQCEALRDREHERNLREIEAEMPEQAAEQVKWNAVETGLEIVDVEQHIVPEMFNEAQTKQREEKGVQQDLEPVGEPLHIQGDGQYRTVQVKLDGRVCGAVRTCYQWSGDEIVFPSLPSSVPVGELTLMVEGVKFTFETKAGDIETTKRAINKFIRQISGLTIQDEDANGNKNGNENKKSIVRRVSKQDSQYEHPYVSMDELQTNEKLKEMCADGNSWPTETMTAPKLVLKFSPEEILHVHLRDIEPCQNRDQFIIQLFRQIHIDVALGTDLDEHQQQYVIKNTIALQSRQPGTFDVTWRDKAAPERAIGGASYKFDGVGLDKSVVEIELLCKGPYAKRGDGVQAGREVLRDIMANAKVPTIVYAFAVCKRETYVDIGMHSVGTAWTEVRETMRVILNGRCPLASNGSLYNYRAKLTDGAADRMLAKMKDSIAGNKMTGEIFVMSTEQWHAEALRRQYYETKSVAIPANNYCEAMQRRRRLQLAIVKAYTDTQNPIAAGEVQLAACQAVWSVSPDAPVDIFKSSNSADGSAKGGKGGKGGKASKASKAGTSGMQMGTACPDVAIFNAAVLLELKARTHKDVFFADSGVGVGNMCIAAAPYCSAVYGWDGNESLAAHREALMGAVAKPMKTHGTENKVKGGAYQIGADDPCYKTLADEMKGKVGLFYTVNTKFDDNLVDQITKKAPPGSVLVHFCTERGLDKECGEYAMTWKHSKIYMRAVGGPPPGGRAVDVEGIIKKAEKRIETAK